MKPEILDGFRNDKLGLIILPTEDCNFRCTYCYEDFEQGKMKPEIVSRLKLFLFNHAETTNELNIEWFGGEPLTAYSTVIDILRYVKQTYVKSRFNGSMTTNGSLLTVKRASELANLGVKTYQISLDGLADTHDKTRKKLNGKGTFKEIWKNLQALKQTKIDFMIKLRVHYSPSTINSVPDLLDEIKSEFGNDSRFSLFLKAVGKYGGADDDKIKVFSHPMQKIIEEKFLEISGMSGIGGSRDSALQNFPVCYACKPNNYVIRANGDISKCTVDLKSERNIIGKLNKDGTIVQNQKKIQFWMRGIYSNNKEQLLCPAHASD